MNQNKNRLSQSNSPHNVPKSRQKTAMFNSNKSLKNSQRNENMQKSKKKNRNEQEMLLVDRSSESKFFQFFPAQFKSIDPRIKEAEEQICREDFYVNQHVALRTRCLSETKKMVASNENDKDSNFFRKTFIQLWPQLLKEEQQNEKWDENYFANHFRCTGEEAFRLVQMDLLKLMLRKPFSKFITASINQINLQAEKQFKQIYKGERPQSSLKQKKQGKQKNNEDSSRIFTPAQKNRL